MKTNDIPTTSEPMAPASSPSVVLTLSLDHGGQVEWVSQGRLPNQAHIALIRYY